MSQPEVLPIVQGDWVATKEHGMGVQIGRVRYSWRDGDEVLMDVVLYSPEGEKVGRTSPAMGGPRSFEPALTFDERWWQRIEKPDFPLVFRDGRVPSSKAGWVTMVYTVQALNPGDTHALKGKPVRTTVKVQARDRARVKPWTAPPPRQIDGEIAALRRAAQELRDTARLEGVSPGPLLARAAELEKEAEALR